MQPPLDDRSEDRSADGEVQFSPVAGPIDLGWGHPDPTLLPTAQIAAATDSLLSRRGWHALAYGIAAGALSLREPLSAHLSATDSLTHPDQIVITGGSSGALDLLLTVMARPGDVVFVEQPTYFLALRMFADHAVEVVGIETDTDGAVPDDLDRRAAELGERRGLLYLVSVHANPTGRCLSADRAAALLEVAARHRLTVIDDDVYRDTSAVSPSSLFGVGQAMGVEVVRFGSFSKVVSPGLRLGHLSASRPLAARIADCGLLDSGGGANHFAAMVMGELVATGGFAALVAEAQQRYAERRAALVGALDRSLLRFDEPRGGYFLWMGLPEGVRSAEVVTQCAAHEVAASNGATFFPSDPTGEFIRVSFSLYGPDTLREGARRLNRAVTAAAAARS